jgi:hypothetical protein
MYHYGVPEDRLRIQCLEPRERTGIPRRSLETDTENSQFCDLYARQLADAQMRALRRGHTGDQLPAYLIAPVFWSDT